jgi:hypothetical protein
MRDVALAATFHDPTGALAADIRRYLPRLQRLYAHVAVACSPPTAPAVRALLAQAGSDGGVPPGNRRGPLYRLALRRALARGAARIHYLDFDRALHWQRRAPREMAAVVRLARRWPVLLVGRTPIAHRSHQRPLYATELVVNRLFAVELGLTGRIDFLAPSFVLTADRAAALLRGSRALDAPVYGEWAALVAGLAPEIAYVECRGLDWETPDRFRRAIRRTGMAAWRRRQETAAEWRLRTEMAAAIVGGFTRTLARRPAIRPALRRLPPRVG